MHVTLYLSLVVFVIVSTISPGGATTVATASGAHFGFKRTIPFMIGIALGLATMGASSAIGLGSILIAMPSLKWLMKIVGSLYLLWLAWKTMQLGSPQLSRNLYKPTGVMGAIFLVWHNPKGWVMALSAAASFADLTHSPIILGAIIGSFFCIAALFSLSFWCSLGLLLSKCMKSDKQWNIFNFVLGAILSISIVPMWLYE